MSPPRAARPGRGAGSGPLLLAIDQGTTGTTVLLLDTRLRVVGRGYEELPQHFPRPGWVEHRGEEIWGTTVRALDRALPRRSELLRRIGGIGLTNQRETVLLWDRGTSRPSAPAIVWQDRRTAERCAALRREGREPRIARRTGLRLDPYFSATKVEWLLRHRPPLRARARSGALAFGTVDTWLLWKLTRGRVHATDPTNASRTLLYDLRRLRWDPEMLGLFGLPDALLPDVRASSGPFGATRGVPGLPDGIPILGVAGDQQAALFGQGCVAPGGLKITYGTGSFLVLHTGRRVVASRAGLLTTVACGPRGEPAYALEGSVFVAGAAVQWLRDGLGLVATAGETERLARSVADAGGTHLVPAFAGLGAPYWRPEARGLWCGLTRGVTRAHLARAALESIAYQARDVVEAMSRDARRRVRSLRVDGGAARNDFLMQFQADLLGVPLFRPSLVETTAAGAAILAGIGAGVWERREEAPSLDRGGREFRPMRPKRERDLLYGAWKEAVSLLLR
ncbi:MAG TPA: glycerol kinase GlpK [Candidatus Eisenbacteria bacterium]|jgi:glycerol kinase